MGKQEEEFVLHFDTTRLDVEVWQDTNEDSTKRPWVLIGYDQHSQAIFSIDARTNCPTGSDVIDVLQRQSSIEDSANSFRGMPDKLTVPEGLCSANLTDFAVKNGVEVAVLQSDRSDGVAERLLASLNHAISGAAMDHARPILPQRAFDVLIEEFLRS